MWTAAVLSSWVDDARRRTLALVSDLEDAQLQGPRLPIVNPLLWESGHVAWFQERWVLRHGQGAAPLRADGDSLWDSSAVAHDTRWDLPLPPRAETLAYMAEVHERVLALLGAGALSAELAYLIGYTVFHEDMHGEAFAYTRQTLGYAPPPRAARPQASSFTAQDVAGDVEVEGGPFVLGARAEDGFAFDNEKWAHPVEVAPFRIARTAVTQGEFAGFVDDGGYESDALWDREGLPWRHRAAARHPVYWKEEDGRWQRRAFDRWVPLEPDLPMVHVNWHEAQAYCRWAGRRLPSEAEWEMAAAWDGRTKRRFPWGEEAGARPRANLDGTALGCVPAAALPEGDSAAGCRQMIGNVWEWTASTFLPYPGFVPDMYRDYSQPWFGTHKVLRGGCWATRSRLLRNTWRNFYTPDRRDVWGGFRTCAP